MGAYVCNRKDFQNHFFYVNTYLNHENIKIFKANEDLEGPPQETKRANHFAFIERATQTKLFEAQDSECQTDPPPM